MVAMLGAEQRDSLPAPTAEEGTQMVSPQSGDTFVTAWDQENM